VNVWAKELKKADDSRKLVFLYLANDVVQTTRRRGQSELIPAFSKIAPDAVGHVYRCESIQFYVILTVNKTWIIGHKESHLEITRCVDGAQSVCFYCS